MSTQSLKALIVEDNRDDADLLILELERGGFEVESERVDTPNSFKKALSERPWDIIFSDHAMPHFNSFQALQIRNCEDSDTPFIIFSGTMGEELAVEAMRAGANDYFVKGRMTRLVAAVNRELQDARERRIRKQTEQELEHFVASLTHDLRAPILGEQRILELMEEGTFGALSAEQRKIIEELLQANHFVQHMVNNILYAYKYKQHQVKLKKVSTDMAQFLTSIASSLSVRNILKERNHNLHIAPTEYIPPVEIDQNEMQRVLLNLIKNAADHTPPGGLITLSLDYLEDFVRLKVEDQGSGVDPEIRPYLFVPYATSAVKKFRQIGIGLGLYLSRQIVEAHGGKINYEPGPKGKGSIFYIDLPV